MDREVNWRLVDGAWRALVAAAAVGGTHEGALDMRVSIRALMLWRNCVPAVGGRFFESSSSFWKHDCMMALLLSDIVAYNVCMCVCWGEGGKGGGKERERESKGDEA